MKKTVPGYHPYFKGWNGEVKRDVPSREDAQCAAREKAGAAFKRGFDKITGTPSTEVNCHYASGRKGQGY